MSSTAFTGTLTTGQLLAMSSPLWFVTSPDVGRQIPGAARLLVVDDINEEASLLLADTPAGTPAAPASGMRLYAQTNMLKGIAADGSLLSLVGSGGQNIPTVYNVKDAPYSATGNGTTNDRPAIQAAMDACQYGPTNGIVYIPPGTYKLDSVLLPNATNTNKLVTIRGAGRGATTLKLGTSGAAFQANFGWSNYAFEDFTLDANFHTGGTLGVLIDCNAVNASVDNISFRRIDVINANTPSFSAERRCINFTLLTPAYQPTQYHLTNILAEDCYFGRSGGGGNYGILVQGYPTAGTGAKASAIFGQPYNANVYIDNIVFNRCTYDSGLTVPSTSVFSSSGFMVGGYGNGNRVRMRDCKVIRPVDDGFELDSMRDVLLEGCYASDAPSESFYFANLGAMPDPERQVIRLINCTDERTAENTVNPTNGAQLNSVGNVGLGHVIIENFTSICRGAACVGPSFEGRCRSLTIRGLRYVSSGWTQTANANGYNRTSTGLRLQLAEGRPKVVLEDLIFDVDGTFDAAGFSTTSYTFNAIDLDVLNDVDLHVRGVQIRGKVNAPNGGSIKGFGIVWNGGAMGTQTEPFTNAPDLVNDFLIDNGASTDIAVSGGVVTSVANPTIEQRRPWLHYSQQYYKGHVGPSTDQAFSVATTPGATLAGYKAGVLLKRTAADQYVECYVADDGAQSVLNIDKVVAGVRTNLATSGALATRISTGTLFTVRGVVRGDTITADYYPAGGVGPALSGSGAATITWTMTNAAELAQFGERAPQGYGGFTWIPIDAAATVESISKYSMSLVRGRIEDVTLAALEGFTNYTGENINAASTTFRFKGFKENGFNWRRGRTATILTEFLGGDATQLAEITRRGIQYATPPVPSAITVGASPFAYTNQSGYDEDVYVANGTVSQVAISRDAGVFYGNVTQATQASVRLAPGEILLVTYTVAPTLTRVPVP